MLRPHHGHGDTDSCSGRCVLATRANRAIASKLCDEDEAQVNIIFARVIPDIQRRTVTSAPQKKEVNFLPIPEIAGKKKTKKSVCAAK